MLAPPQSSAPTAARLLRAVALDLARRANHRLPGIADAIRNRTVIRADGVHVVGVLGSFQALAWSAGDEHFDKITITLRHSAHQALDPAHYAHNVLTTLAHEITHAYMQMNNLVGTTGPGRIRHTENFALIAKRLGLRVERRAEHPAAVFTPGLSTQGRTEFADLIQQLTAANLARTTGIGYAGPERFNYLVAQASTEVLPAADASMFDPASASATSFIR